MKRDELLQRIQSNSAPLLVDPRSEMEFKRGHIPGAVNAPVRKILFGTARLPEDRNREMVIACMHGQRAWLAKKILALRGYRNMALLDGWLQEWQRAGLPWVKEA
jgi:rhodanese-related sulfurtransferase